MRICELPPRVRSRLYGFAQTVPRKVLLRKVGLTPCVSDMSSWVGRVTGEPLFSTVLNVRVKYVWDRGVFSVWAE